MSSATYGSALLCMVLTGTGALAAGFAPLVEGVDSVCVLASPGPLWALNGDVTPIAGSDADSMPPGMPVVVAVEVDAGRVVACGHEQFLSNDNLGLRDNRRFAENVVDWLVGSRPRRVIATTGHQEWFGGPNFSALKADLESRGYQVSRYAGAITPDVLAKAGVVIVGNAWGTIAPEEVAALEAFVRGGGGLLLGGLGWSWQAYQGPLDAYPMNELGRRFGIEWIDGSFSDPTDSDQGAPIFRVFYPALYPATMSQACSYIDSLTAAHPVDLPAALEAQPGLRKRYRLAHLVLAQGSRYLTSGSPQRRELYAFQQRLVTTYPALYGKSVVYDPGAQAAMAWARERAYCTFADALPRTPLRSVAIADAMGLTGRYRDLWVESGVLLLDNSRCDSAQRQFLYRYLKSLPSGLHNLRRIGVASYVGQPDPGPMAGDLRDLEGREAGINLWDGRIGDSRENSFPGDVAPGRID
ncbi:MAG: hypothetical protein FJX75_10295, partial [Armatimonadetes bacterium]|nr:hypothetical protein [Armatimonadota bacterium]